MVKRKSKKKINLRLNQPYFVFLYGLDSFFFSYLKVVQRMCSILAFLGVHQRPQMLYIWHAGHKRTNAVMLE